MRTTVRFGVFGALAALASLALAGCGAKQGEVSGTISYDGKPIENGSVTFVAEDGKSTTAGGTIKGGKYTVQNVPVGRMQVRITGSEQKGTKKLYNTPDSPELPMYVTVVPEKYNVGSELRYEVKPGRQEKNFDLTK